MVRLFISINVPIEIKKDLASFQRKLIDLVDGNFVSRENMHITMKFLGDVKDEQVAQIKTLCADAVFGHKFLAEVKGAGAFPAPNFARIIWAGVGAGSVMLSQIRDALDSKLDHLGFKEDRDFHAHITLVRVKRIKNKQALVQLIKNNKETMFGKFGVEAVNLMKSELGRAGAVHSKVSEFSLS